MRIDNRHMEKLAEMLGKPSVTWSRLGAYYSPDRVDILDDMVSVGLVRVEETVEAWGPCVTYTATDYAKSILARNMLYKEKE